MGDSISQTRTAVREVYGFVIYRRPFNCKICLSLLGWNIVLILTLCAFCTWSVLCIFGGGMIRDAPLGGIEKPLIFSNPGFFIHSNTDMHSNSILTHNLENSDDDSSREGAVPGRHPSGDGLLQHLEDHLDPPHGNLHHGENEIEQERQRADEERRLVEYNNPPISDDPNQQLLLLSNILEFGDGLCEKRQKRPV